MKFVYTLAGVFIALTLAAHGCVPAVQGETLKIGLLTPLTGPAPEWGKKQVIGMEMAVDHINRRGGVMGRPIRVVTRDTGGDGEQALAAYRQLSRQDKVLAVVGPFYSSECERLFPETTAEKLVVIATASAKPGLSNLSTQPYAFRTAVPSGAKEEYLLREWSARNRISTVAIVYDDRESVTKSLAQKVWPEILGMIGVTDLTADSPLRFATGERNFEDVASALKGVPADGICISALNLEAAHLLKEIRRQGIDKPVMGGSAARSSALVDIAGAAAEGFMSVGFFNADDPNLAVQRYVKEFMQRCSQTHTDMTCDPEKHDVAVYDILHFLTDVMKKADITNMPDRLEQDRQNIRDGLAGMKRWRGIAGMFAFDKKGDGIRTMHLLTVRNGKWQSVH